jgi:nicotinamidase-related amidase
LLLPPTCSRASLKTDAFAYNHSTLIQIPVEDNLMPVTALDPKTVLIVVDLQKGIINSPFIHPVAGVIERTCALLDAFRQRDLPVVLVNVVGGAPGRTEQPRRFSTLPDGFSDLIPELGRQASDIVVTKRTWGAFASTDLEAQLKASGVTQVVVTGVATGTGVEATAHRRMSRDSTSHLPSMP